MNTDERAYRAQQLRDSETFQTVISEIREDAIAAFLNSGPKDTEAREEAHGIIRALSKIDEALEAMIGAKAIADKKKGQHRASD